MAIKKIQIIPPDNNYGDILHPETQGSMVKMSSGNNLETDIAKKVDKTIITAANDFIVGSGVGAVVKKTLAEVRTLLSCLLTTGGTMSGELNCADNLLTRAYLKDYAEVRGTTPATTGTVTLDLTTGNTFNITPTGNVTFAFTNPPATNRIGSFTLIINNGTTAYSKTFPSSVKWDNDTIPDMSAVNKTIILTFVTQNAGARWYGISAGTKFTT